MQRSICSYKLCDEIKALNEKHSISFCWEEKKEEKYII